VGVDKKVKNARNADLRVGTHGPIRSPPTDETGGWSRKHRAERRPKRLASRPRPRHSAKRELAPTGGHPLHGGGRGTIELEEGGDRGQVNGTTGNHITCTPSTDTSEFRSGDNGALSWGHCGLKGKDGRPGKKKGSGFSWRRKKNGAGGGGGIQDPAFLRSESGKRGNQELREKEEEASKKKGGKNRHRLGRRNSEFLRY